MTGIEDLQAWYIKDLAEQLTEANAKIIKLERDNTEMASQLLDPDATCCADASRVHKEQRLEIERLKQLCRYFVRNWVPYHDGELRVDGGAIIPP